MDDDLCLCDVCCSEDASEASEDLQPQFSAQNTNQREEELDEKYSQWCDSFMETEEYEEALKHDLNQGDDFFQNKFRQAEKRKSERIAHDEYEGVGTKLEEMQETVEERSEYCMRCMSLGGLGSSSCGDCGNYDHNNDLKEFKRVEQEDENQDISGNDWGYSTEEL
ncbi:hypothetical protein BOTNAR_0150g00170 [Botryotinia narcissicola]|uniref:Uncharacterized protein n=1 Tax=Botryotinia narcissicola TaxID=278944 RepID=A0A4Z1IFL4_9HELO|nr:hypothetical protein BOTNAR_0150g00170 [Botryotinia narcissicola]